MVEGILGPGDLGFLLMDVFGSPRPSVAEHCGMLGAPVLHGVILLDEYRFQDRGLYYSQNGILHEPDHVHSPPSPYLMVDVLSG